MTREFLVDINPNIELPKYELILYNLYEQPITSLKNITDFNYKAFFIGIDEISFNIPAYRNEYDGQKVRNEIYDLVDGEYYILLNDKKYFIIDKINEKADDDGDLYKEIHAYSREYELSQKKVIDYKADSRLLYDSSNSIDENGLEKGILNYIFNHVTKSWSIGNIDADLTSNEVHRALDFPNTNLIQVFQELQKIYNCIFMFDTINQKIDILKMDSQKIGQNKGLYISDGNFIKSLSKNINYDEVKTRLFVYGKDNISIQSISPTGQPYLDNFDTFKNTKFMTQDLIDALNSYQVKIENYNPDFEPLLTQLQEANQVMENLINADDIDINNKGLVALERALSNVQTLIDVKTEELAIVRKSIESATGTDLESLYADMKSIQSALGGYETEKENINTLIANKQAEIDNQQGVIDGIKQQMADLQYVLDMNNPANFTAEQLKELDKFIRIETYNDSNYTENNIVELYEEGKKMLTKISQPQIQFDVDVVDFLSIVECQHVWKKFILGDIITLEHKELGFDFEVRLVGYEHNEEENSLNLKFSNTYTFDDDTLWMRDLLDEINTTATAVDFNKYKWDKPDYLESKISKYIDMKLEEARQNILNAVGQRYLFDDSGLWLYKENPDGTLNPEQIRAINNTIALTEDNWNTVGTAITPQGINAQYLRGKVGQFAKISADQVEVGDEEQPLLEYIDTELTDTVNNLGDVINDALSDEKLTNIEANSIQLALDNVTAESANLISTATSLSITTEKTNYQNALATLTNNLNTNWLGKEYPLEITHTQRMEINNQFKDLENKKTILVNKISEVRANKAYQDAKNYTDNNALKQNFYYNRTKITESEGIEVFDNLGNRVLQTGGFDSDGDGVKDMYGHVAYHSDGSLSALVRDGFLKRTQYGDNYYLNSAVIIEGETIYNGGNHPPNNVRIDLPMYMKNRNVAISLGLNESSIEYMGSKQSLDGDFLSENHLNIIEKKLSASPPYIIVSAYSYTKTFGTLKGVHYTGVKFNVMVVSD